MFITGTSKRLQTYSYCHSEILEANYHASTKYEHTETSSARLNFISRHRRILRPSFSPLSRL